MSYPNIESFAFGYPFSDGDFVVRFVLLLMECRHSTDREIAIMILMAYLSYILAEARFTVHVNCPCKRMLFQQWVSK
jgi:hypothetical protein